MVSFKKIGKLQEAEIFTRKATELNQFRQSSLQSWNLMKELGNLQEAEISFRKSELDPNFDEAHSN